MSVESKCIVSKDFIENKIVFVRGKKVMLDFDLAQLYGVETKHLKRAVKRNLSRFPYDFMIELTKEEQESLRCHFGTLKRGQHIKYLPYAFTEQGVAMLSSVLNSERAIQVNIQIMRVFTQLREMMLSHRDLKERIDALEKRYDAQFRIVFEAIRKLMTEEEKPKRGIGFHVKN